MVYEKKAEGFLNQIVDHIFPEFVLQNSPWHSIWVERRKASFLAKAPFIFAIIAAVYILHHFFVDKPIGLNWGLYRFSSAAGALSVLLIYYFFGETLEKYLKIPAMIAFLCFCHFQAKTILWYTSSISRKSNSRSATPA